jgi:hypothetical protein
VIRGLDRLVAAVQRNCDIGDARHAADLSLCTYLLEMREFYRWECDIPFTDQLSRAEVGAWLAGREALWESLEDAAFEALPVEQARFEPFAMDAINAALVPHGLLYSAGLGRQGRAQFHLGEFKRAERRGEVRVLVGGCEYARDLGSAPATLRGATVVIRQESFRRWLWERFETWGIRRVEGPMEAALAAYGFDGDALGALERMTQGETETLILHELGEFAAGRQLGPQWEALYASSGGGRTELALRALRDNLADCLVTLPALLERASAPSIHFWFATFEGLRSELFPALKAAYRPWRGGDPAPLSEAIAAGREHWSRVCGEVLAAASEPEGAQALAQRLKSPELRL